MSFEPLALIGASCRFPGAPDLDAFADLLANGRDAVGEIPDERWAKALYYHPDRGQPGKSYTFAAGCLDQVDQFDPMFFGISPREAVQMDPQQRLLLELMHEAVEDAGIDGSRLAGRAVGVYIGGSSSDYATLRLGDPSCADAYFMTGSTLCSLANRISYIYDLRGPSFTVDTACSSSLVALHLAAEALGRGEIAMAVVGGVNLLLAPQSFIGFSRASMLSRTGRCHAFDARADGYVRAEGGGLVLIKRLADARADGDMIRAVIRGTGVNSDGRTTGFSLPNRAAQEALLEEVYARAGVTPDELVYLEAHGTGTPVGDPIEAAAIGKVLGQPRGTPLPIGSVKTNIGHLEPASGMAGLLKVVIALERGIVPASLHSETPNPHIPFDELNLKLLRQSEPIRPSSIAGGSAEEDGAAIAAVNSFGFGGTNAHAIIAGAPRGREEGVRGGRRPASLALPPLLLSARSDEALVALARSWRAWLAGLPTEDVAPALRGAARTREQHPLRLVVNGRTRTELLDGLDRFVAGESAPSVVTGTALPQTGLIFVFSGNGSQWAGMGAEALHRNAAFARALRQVDAELMPLLGWSVAEHLAAAPDEAAMRRTGIAQPLLFAVQVASVMALRQLGVTPAACIGHSAGEVAASWAAGALSLTQAAQVIAHRSHRQQQTHGDGRMAVLNLSAGDAAAAIAELDLAEDDRIEVAAVNASASVTVAGRAPGLAALAALARQRGWLFTELDLDYAFHSEVMAPIEAGLLADLAELAPSRTTGRLISTVTGAEARGPELDAGYWWRNVRLPVRFAEGIAGILAQGPTIFLEIGPQPVLQSYLHDALRQADLQAPDGQGPGGQGAGIPAAGVRGRVLSSLSRRPAGQDPFLGIVARCHAAGYAIQGSATFDGPLIRRGLPAYPWQRERYWTERTVEATDTLVAKRDHPLLGYRRGAAPDAWFSHLSTLTEPWLGDHVVDRSAVLPAAAMIDMALAAARARHEGAAALQLLDLEIVRPLVLEPERAREVTVTVDSGGGFALASRGRLSDEPWTEHATGRLGVADDAAPPGALPPLPEIERRVAADDLYALAARHGLEYGPEFRAVAEVALAGSADAAVALRVPPLAIPRDRIAEGYLVDPALLDGALQGLVALAAPRVAAAGAGAGQIGLVPWRFGRVRMLRPAGAQVAAARLHITRAGPRSVCADIVLLDGDGATVAELGEAWFVAVPLGRSADPEAGRFHTVQVASGGAAPTPDLLALVFAAGVFAVGEDATPDAMQDEAAVEPAVLADAYATAVCFAAVTEIVGDRAAGFELPVLIDAGRVHADAEPVLSGVLGWLEADELAVRDGSVWRLADATGLPPAPEVWRSLLFDVPAAVADTALVGAAGEGLAETLRLGQAEPPPAALLEQMLTASPSGLAALGGLCAAVEHVVAAWPVARPLRVLELGAQRGAATRRLLGALDGRGMTLRYVATALSADDLPSLAEVTAAVSGASARLWRPTRSAAEDALGDERFDIVLGLYPLSRMRLGASELAILRERLAPGGLLLVAEPEPNRVWGLIFGLDPDWWRRRHGEFVSPLLEAAEWDALLIETGFEAARHDAVRHEVAGPGAWPVSLIGARRDQLPAAVLPADGPPVAVFAPAGLADTASALCEALLAAGRSAHVEALEAFGNPASDTRELVVLLDPGADDAAVVENAASWLAALAASTARLAEAPPHRLWLVCCDVSDTFAGMLQGARRVLANEAPGVDCRLLRLAPEIAGMAPERIAGEILAPDAEPEIALTAAGRLVPRVRRGLPAAPVAADPVETRLAVVRPGLLDTLAWQAQPAVAPGPGEIAIAVRAAGLNFRDVMWALGLLPDEALLHGFAGPTLGLECAGVVTALGEGVAGLAVGDRVMACAPASLGTSVVTARHAAIRMPEGLGFAEAATIPVAFLTVAYALGTLARLAPGERVLIHGGAGAVGLAAIQYARHRGAVVFATAGSPAKRAALRLLGVDHVMDSRSLAFADEVMQLTGHEGVDVVLNSLSGEAMERSLRLLRPFGRFLELGKRDLYRNTAVGIRPLRHNASYFAIDADQLAMSRPAVAGALFAEIEGLFAQGALRALPHRLFAFDAAPEAFRLMQAAGHIGKIVLVPGARPPRPAAPPASFAARADRTYVLTGALGGFGLETARWLARHGARHLALLSRKGADTAGSAAALAAFAREGVQARAYACDVSDAPALDATLSEIRAVMPPIGGVVHAAMVLDDGFLPQLDHARFAAVLRPKVMGASLLDRLTRDDPIELFLLFSSVTTVLGNPGQANYVAANSALEAVAERRHAAGLPALAVAWGPIGDVGVLARQGGVSEALMRRLGTAHMASATALDALPALLAAGVAVAGQADLRWATLRQQLPLLRAPLFADLTVGGAPEAADVDLRALLADRSPEEARALIVGLLVEEVGGILKLAPDRIDPERPLAELGMDSLMAVELRLSMEQRFGLTLPLLSLGEGLTLAGMAARVVRALSSPDREMTEVESMVDRIARFEPASVVPLPTAKAAAAPSAPVPLGGPASQVAATRSAP